MSWVPQIPSGWRVARLKELLQECDERVNGGHDSFELLGLSKTKGVVRRSELDQSASEASDYGKYKVVRPGNIVMNKMQAWNGVFGLAEFGGMTSPDYSIFRLVADSESKFIEALLRTPLYAAVFSTMCRGMGTAFLRLNTSEFLGTEIPLPPPDEQVAIARFLKVETSRLDALIKEQERLIEILNEKRQTVISHAITKGLNSGAPMRPSHVPWLGDVPAHWQVRALRTLANVVRGASPRPAGDPKFFHGHYIPWVTVAEITKDDHFPLDSTSEFLTAEGCQRSRVFRAGTVIYSNSGATLGVPRILQMDACANDGVVGFERLNDALTSSFLCHFLSALTKNVREMLKQGSGQPNLNTDIVKGFQVALPPLSEQRTIVTELDRLAVSTQKLVEEATQAIALLQERRSAIVSSAVTGQIDVREREAAEVA
jgi:type I restriction enzyme S subunit